MKAIVLVGLGGGIGSIARYLIGDWLRYATAPDRFPVATFVVNIVGCLIAGMLAGMIARYDVLSPQVRLFLFTGLLGGFTTFSAFGLETTLLLRRGEIQTAATYAVASLVLGIAAVWIGYRIACLGAPSA